MKMRIAVSETDHSMLEISTISKGKKPSTFLWAVVNEDMIQGEDEAIEAELKQHGCVDVEIKLL